MFSTEYSQAIFNVGNVELIQLKNSTIQCPSCLLYIFEGTFLCNCGKLLELDADKRCQCGQNPRQLHSKLVPHFEALQKASEDLRQSGTDGKIDAAYRQPQLVHNWSDVWVRYLDHIVQFSIVHNAPQQQRERIMQKNDVRSVDENEQAPPLSLRPGYREAKEQLSNSQKENNKLLLSQ